MGIESIGNELLSHFIASRILIQISATVSKCSARYAIDSWEFIQMKPIENLIEFFFFFE